MQLVVKNTFSIWKKKIEKKNFFHVVLVLDVLITCCFFQNSIHGQRHVDIQTFLHDIEHYVLWF